MLLLLPPRVPAGIGKGHLLHGKSKKWVTNTVVAICYLLYPNELKLTCGRIVAVHKTQIDYVVCAEFVHVKVEK